MLILKTKDLEKIDPENKGLRKPTLKIKDLIQDLLDDEKAQLDGCAENYPYFQYSGFG